MVTALITAHADVVGSLLRPSELLRAQEERAAGRMTPTAFKEIEDSAVDWAVRLQEEAGLEVVTDGEMRRLSFQSQMTEAVRGFGRWDSTPSSGAIGTGSRALKAGGASGPRISGSWVNSSANATFRPKSSYIFAAAPSASPR